MRYLRPNTDDEEHEETSKPLQDRFTQAERKEYWEKRKLEEEESMKPKSTWQSGEWNFSSLNIDINKIIWKCLRRLNKEGNRSGDFHWIPVKMVKLENSPCGRYRKYYMQVVLAESTTKKREIGARDFGPSMNPQMREGAHRTIYEISGSSGPEKESPPEFKIFNKVRDLDPDEILPDGYENIVPGNMFPFGTSFLWSSS